LIWGKQIAASSGKLADPIPSSAYGGVKLSDLDFYDNGSLVTSYTTISGTAGRIRAHISKYDEGGNEKWHQTRDGINGRSSSSYCAVSKEDGGAWWVVDDQMDWYSNFSSPAPYSNFGLKVFEIAEQLDNNNDIIARITSQQVYQEPQGIFNLSYGSFSNFSIPFLPAALLDVNNGFVMAGIANDRNFQKDCPFFVRENLSSQCPTYIDDDLNFYGRFDGHNYFLSLARATREDAFQKALALGGNLLTINSEREQAFI